MSRKRKTSLKDMLKIFTGSKNMLKSEPCENPSPAPPLDIPYPNTNRNRTDKTTNKVKITGDIIKVLSDFKASSGDESGTDDNTLSNIFTRVLTRARKKKKD